MTTIACINRASKVLVDGISGGTCSGSISSNTSCDVNTRSGTTISGALWSSLWLRDYGSVLLDWDVSRNAFRKSLASQPNSNLDSNSNASDVEITARPHHGRQINPGLDRIYGQAERIIFSVSIFLCGLCIGWPQRTYKIFDGDSWSYYRLY